MAKRSEIHFQKGVSLAKFQVKYGTEEQCASALFSLKWPKGYHCPKCGHHKYIQLRCRPLYQCKKCRHQTSLLARTIFASIKLPLTILFLAIFLVSQSKEGISSLKLLRFLGVSANAAMRLKHTIQMVISVKTTGRYDSPDFTFFDWLNTIIGNIKNALIGTYHGMNHNHLPRYLGEFCFRFNRRFKLGLLLKSLMYHAAQTTSIPGR